MLASKSHIFAASRLVTRRVAMRQNIQSPIFSSKAWTINTFSTTRDIAAQEKTLREFNQIAKLPDVWSRDVLLADLVEDFRELQSLEALRGQPGVEAVRELKSATRALIALLHETGDPDQLVRLDIIEKVLPKANGRAWKVIKEKLESGTPRALEDVDERKRTLALFTRLNSIGLKRAERFYELGYRTLDDLKEDPDLTHAQKIGLQYFSDFEALIPRSEVDDIAATVGEAVKAADPAYESEIVGSYRRGEPWSSDVDLVVRHPTFDGTDVDIGRALLKKIFTGFADIDLLSKKPLADGAKRYHTLVKLPDHRHARRLDLRLVGWHDYHYMLLGSTGDLDLMKYLRQVAANKGLFLSEYGMGPRITGVQRGMQKGADMFDPRRRIIVNSEEEIFAALGLPYVEPTKRSYRYWNKILPRLPQRV